MKKLPWIIMGLLFLSGIGMIAWSLFPMPVKLISGKLTGDKLEKTVGGIQRRSFHPFERCQYNRNLRGWIHRD